MTSHRPVKLTEADDPDVRIYACYVCGKMRSKNEGGTVFTVCDACWGTHFQKRRAALRSHKGTET